MLPSKILTGTIAPATGQEMTAKNVLEQFIIEESARTGRPAKYTSELAADIINRYSRGQNLVDICDNPDMPSRITLRNWEMRYPEFLSMMNTARELKASAIVDQTLQLSDLAATLITKDDRPDGVRVAIQGKQWAAERLDPDRWAQRQKVDISITNDLGTALLAAKQRLNALEAQDAEIVEQQGIIEADSDK